MVNKRLDVYRHRKIMPTDTKKTDLTGVDTTLTGIARMTSTCVTTRKTPVGDHTGENQAFLSWKGEEINLSGDYRF